MSRFRKEQAFIILLLFWMHYHFSFYSSILLIFFTQGILFSALLLKKGITENEAHHKWLSLFVGLCSVYLLPFMLGFAGWYSLQPYQDILFYLPLQQTLFIGPAIYFYTKSLLNPEFEFSAKHRFHFIPGFLYLLFSLIVFISDKLILRTNFFYADGRDKDFDVWYQVLGLVSMLSYAILCIRYYLIYRKFIFQYSSFADYSQLKWVNRYLWVFTLMVLIQLVFFVLFPNWGSFLQKWWYYLMFAILNYYLGIQGFITTIKGTVPFFVIHQAPLFIGYLPQAIPLAISFNENNTTGESYLEPNSGVPDDEILAWKKKLESLIVTEGLYTNPNLTLMDIAQRLETHPTFISRIVNRVFQMNFNDWINGYRVNAVILRFEKNEHINQTLLGIALDCGFNSKTTFNRCFRKTTGLAPREYLKNLGPNHDLGRREV